MPADLEVIEGKASFVYNGRNGLPWHRMGTPVDGNQPISVMLQKSGADFTAYRGAVYVETPRGQVLVEDKIGICADRPTGPGGAIETTVFATMGDGYTIVQYAAVAEKAEAIVGASKGQAIMDTMGLLKDGKRFFAYLDLGSVFIDPSGINDEIKRGLLLHSSHDGSIAVTYAETDVRAVCANTVALGLATASQVYKAKHTLSVEDKMEEAEKVMGFQARHTEALIKEAEKLLRVSWTPDRFEKVLTSVFPEPKGATERQRRNTDEARVKVRGIFENERNAANYGRNGWTMYNAITEYLDHHRKATDEDRAIASMTPGTWVQRSKEKAGDLILALGA